jgi:hypothetical protein
MESVWKIMTHKGMNTSWRSEVSENESYRNMMSFEIRVVARCGVPSESSQFILESKGGYFSD